MLLLGFAFIHIHNDHSTRRLRLTLYCHIRCHIFGVRYDDDDK